MICFDLRIEKETMRNSQLFGVRDVVDIDLRREVADDVRIGHAPYKFME